jgi:GT2 family glycosyltransferase
MKRVSGYITRLIELAGEQGIRSAWRAVVQRIRFAAQKNIVPEQALAYYEARPEALISDSRDPSVPKVSILVLTFNNLTVTQACLRSIYCNTAYPKFEVVVVDNASTDGTPAWLQSYAENHRNMRVILNNENRGFYAGNNQAAAVASGDYLVFLNNDTLVTLGWLQGLLAYLQDDPAVGMVGPVTNSTGNEARIPVNYSTPAEMEEFAVRLAKSMKGHAFDIRSLALYCVMLRAREFQELGGLDERFGTGMFEDEDLALRYSQAGFRVICADDVFIHHFWRASFRKMSSPEYQALFDGNRRKFEEKWGRQWKPYRYRSW